MGRWRTRPPTQTKGDEEMTWSQVKHLRAEIVGSVCEICGRSLPKHEMIGHHIIGRCRGKHNDITNVQLRCRECEEMMHALYKDGNGGEPKIKVKFISLEEVEPYRFFLYHATRGYILLVLTNNRLVDHFNLGHDRAEAMLDYEQEKQARLGMACV